jgi:multiple sugar transport system permease protein
MSNAVSMSARKRAEYIAGYLFILPQLLGILVFAIIPVIAVIGLTFFEWSIVGIPKFVGFANYMDQIASDDMHKAVINTLYYTVLTIPFQLIFALLLSIAVNHIKGKVIYRCIYFSPVVTNSVAVSMVWMWLYNGEFGVLNLLLKNIGVQGPNWIVDMEWVMPSIAVMSIWQGVGYYMVLFLSGLQGIPNVYYEAAKIDGASGFAQFRHITLPMLSSTTFFIVIMAIIGSFQVFDQTFIMTNGGPAKASYCLVLHIYQNAFQFFKMGIATTASVMLFILILIVTLVQFKLQKKWVYYES